MTCEQCPKMRVIAEEDSAWFCTLWNKYVAEMDENHCGAIASIEEMSND